MGFAPKRRSTDILERIGAINNPSRLPFQAQDGAIQGVDKES
jgi:hypothetical protein